MPATFVTGRIVSAQQLERLSLGSAGQFGLLSHAASGAGLVTEEGTPSLTVNVAAIAALDYVINGAVQTTAYSASTVTHDAADGSNPRIDIVKINTSGTVGIKKGTAAADPVPSDLASTEMALSMNLIAAGATTVQTADIADRRQFLTSRPTQYFRKTTDETVNNSDTLQDDDDWAFSVAANTKYRVDIYALIDSGTTPDWKVQWSLPAGATADFVISQPGGGSTSANPVTESAAADVAGLGAGTPVFARIHGILIIAGTAGTAVPQWAQNTANASDTKLLAGSVMVVEELT